MLPVRQYPFRILLGIAIAMWPFHLFADSGLEVGDPAPAFELVDQNGHLQRLADYAGRWVVVYFYPKNDTPGCTTEACSFRDDILQLRALEVVLLGVSLDGRESHARFAEKYGLPFPLLADTEGAIAKVYGALFKLGPLRFAKRHTFIIDPQGRIARVFRDVDAKTHSDEIIAVVRELQVHTR